MRFSIKTRRISNLSILLILSSFCISNFNLTPIINAKELRLDDLPAIEKQRMPESNQQSNIHENEIIVKYRKTKINLRNQSGKKRAADLAKKKGFAKSDEITSLNMQKLRSSDNLDERLIELKKDPDVEIAEPNFKRFPTVTSVNDPFFSGQWALEKIRIPQAWDMENSPEYFDTTVAVIDTGVYYNHEDLIQNMWDGSSLCIDDAMLLIPEGCPNHGWDYRFNDNDPIGESMISDDMEIGPHGTWVSGIIAANSNNSTGISGMSHNNNIKIMAISFDMDVFSEIKAINFAENNGASVINASFGGPEFSQLEKDAITNFTGIFVAAAGNSNADNDISHNYPSDYDNGNIISVAATDENDALAYFSNYGASSVDIAAPGTDITTTYFDSNDSYASVSGTSFSAPIISGAVALLKNKNTSFSTSELKSLILNYGDPLPIPTDASKILSGKRLNLYASITDRTPPSSPSSLAVE